MQQKQNNKSSRKYLLSLLYTIKDLLLLIPVSIVYLIIMSVIETITHGIPETLGCILDKLVIVVSGIGSVALIIFLIAQIG